LKETAEWALSTVNRITNTGWGCFWKSFVIWDVVFPALLFTHDYCQWLFLHNMWLHWLTEELAARSGCVLSMIMRGCWVVPVLNEAFQCGHSVNQRPITSTIFLWGWELHSKFHPLFHPAARIFTLSCIQPIEFWWKCCGCLTIG
jgi:hypothetical protein